jgi:hypothetical protein
LVLKIESGSKAKILVFGTTLQIALPLSLYLRQHQIYNHRGLDALNSI